MKTSDTLRAAAEMLRRTDTRGTRTPSAKTEARREMKHEANRLALRSANEAGYRRGKDEQDRELNTRHDQAINVLRNAVAMIEANTIALMDREHTKGWLELVAYQNRTNPDSAVIIMSMRAVNAIARELTRAYDKEKQS
jgi:hypothetical protein